MKQDKGQRCGWCLGDPLYMAYHDKEWGVPLRDDRKLFEMLLLDGAQAGLSWLTILKKREHYRQAFDSFDPHKLCRYGSADMKRLLADKGIVRNRLKIEAFIKNARAMLALQEETGSFADFLWRYVDGETIQNTWATLDEIPTKTTEAERMSRDLKKRGFSFVGPTICYAFMQAAGMVNDHIVSCFRHRELK